MLRVIYRSVIAVHWAIMAFFVLRLVAPRELWLSNYTIPASFVRTFCIFSMIPFFYWLESAAHKVALGYFRYGALFMQYHTALHLCVLLSSRDARRFAWWVQTAHLFFFSFFAQSPHFVVDVALTANLAVSLCLYLIPLLLEF